MWTASLWSVHVAMWLSTTMSLMHSVFFRPFKGEISPLSFKSPPPPPPPPQTIIVFGCFSHFLSSQEQFPLLNFISRKKPCSCMSVWTCKSPVCNILVDRLTHVRTDWPMYGQTDRCTDRLTDVRTDWPMYGQTDRCTDRLTDVRTDWPMYGQTDRCTDRLTDVRTDWPMYGQTDRCTDRLTDVRTDWLMYRQTIPALFVCTWMS